MPELTSKLFRNYFGGTWKGTIKKKGELNREIIFNWPAPFGTYSSLGTPEGLITPPCSGALDDTKQIAMAGWRPDLHRWCHVWHNEFGGYGEVQWTSQNEIHGINVIYGFAHECKQETDDMTDHIVKCELFDEDNFQYTLRSFRKGVTKVVAHRLRTAEELNALLEKQTHTILNIKELHIL